MQFIILNGDTECPACGTVMTIVREQDKRVAVMLHSRFQQCSCSGKQYRIDRHTGYGEEVRIRETQPAEVQISHGCIAP